MGHMGRKKTVRLNNKKRNSIATEIIGKSAIVL